MANEKAAMTKYNKWLQTEFAAALAHRLVQAAKKKTASGSQPRIDTDEDIEEISNHGFIRAL